MQKNQQKSQMLRKLDWSECLSNQVSNAYIMYNPMMALKSTVPSVALSAAPVTPCQMPCSGAGVALTTDPVRDLSCACGVALPRVAQGISESVLLREVDFGRYYLARGDRIWSGPWNSQAINSRAACYC
jgi:hypothetical protein